MVLQLRHKNHPRYQLRGRQPEYHQLQRLIHQIWRHRLHRILRVRTYLNQRKLVVHLLPFSNVSNNKALCGRIVSSASTSGVLGSSSSSSSTVSHSAPSKASENKLSVFGNKLKSALIKLGTVGGTISDSDSDAEREHKTGKQLPDSLP